jgi:hypothetical protein
MITFMPSHKADSAKERNDDEEKQLIKADSPTTISHSTPTQPSGTLLPASLATLVSAGTGIGAFGVRAGTKVAGWGLYAGRESTLKTLSLSRTAAEAVLYLAGRDVAARSTSELSHQDAVSLLSRSVRMPVPRDPTTNVHSLTS